MLGIVDGGVRLNGRRVVDLAALLVIQSLWCCFCRVRTLAIGRISNSAVLYRAYAGLLSRRDCSSVLGCNQIVSPCRLSRLSIVLLSCIRMCRKEQDRKISAPVEMTTTMTTMVLIRRNLHRVMNKRGW